MKRFKIGFTLAEVLITLSIIGVIAAMTMPSLQVNVQKQQVGPALAKAINTLETTNKLIIADGYRHLLEFLSYFSKDYLDARTYFKNIGKYLSIKEIDLPKYTNYDYTEPFKFSVAYEDKNGIIYLAEGWSYEFDSCDKAKNFCSGFDLYIDVNGNKKPNAIGRDTFPFLVDYSGQVIPWGGKQFLEYINDEENSDAYYWEKQCASTTKKAPLNALYCSGAIVDNGFRVLY